MSSRRLFVRRFTRIWIATILTAALVAAWNAASAQSAGKAVAATTTTLDSALNRAKRDPKRDARLGPFGFSLNLTAAGARRLGGVEIAGQPDRFRIQHAPNGHAAFEMYTVTVDDTFGLCQLVAFGKEIASSSFGNEIRSAFADIEKPLKAKYGEGNHHDFLQSGSIWNDPQDFMMGLYKKERVLSDYWGAETGLDSAAAGVTAAMLEAKALGTSTGYLSLTYEFANSGACLEARKAKKNEVF